MNERDHEVDSRFMGKQEHQSDWSNGSVCISRQLRPLMGAALVVGVLLSWQAAWAGITHRRDFFGMDGHPSLHAAALGEDPACGTSSRRDGFVGAGAFWRGTGRTKIPAGYLPFSVTWAARARQGGSVVPAPRSKHPSTCRSDEQCGKDRFCSKGKCRKLKSDINIAYLFMLSGNRRFLSVLGLYMHKLGRKGFRTVFPLYWSFWKPGRKSRVLFPFYWDFSSGKSRFIYAFPLVGWRRTGKRTDTVVAPFHWWHAPGRHGFNVWPLLFYANYGKRGGRFTFLPFGHWQRDGRYSAYGFLNPLGFFYGSKSPGHRTWALIPWLYGTARPNRAFSWWFPLNFYWRHGSRRRYLGLPLVYAERRPYSRFTMVLPLYWDWGRGDSRHYLLAPLFYRSSSPGRSYTQFLNFYHVRRGAKSYGSLFPLLFYGHNRAARTRYVSMLPFFYYSSDQFKRQSVFLSPVYAQARSGAARWWAWFLPPVVTYRDPYRSVDLALPLLYWRYRNRLTQTHVFGVGPFLYYRDAIQTNSFLFPIWWSLKDRRTGAYARLAFPLYYQSRSVQGRVRAMAGPVFWAYGAGRPWSAGLAPLLFFGAGKGRGHAVVFPLFWHFWNKKGTKTLAGPFYYSRWKNGWASGLAPLAFLGKNGHDNYQFLFPFFWHSKKNGRHLALAGPLYASWGRKRWGFGLAPLFFAAGGRGRGYQVLFPLFGHWYGPKSRSLVAGPAYSWRRGDNWGWGVAPFLFFARHYRHGRVSSSLTLFPFFHSSYRKGRELLVTPLGGYSKRPGSLTAMVGPFVWHRGRKYRGWALLPWVYHWENEARSQSTTIAFPFIRQKSPKQDATVLFPFYWSFRRPNEKSLLVFPFYWHYRKKHGLSADVAFPFYWRLKTPKSSFLMAGPYYQRRTTSGYSAGIWPLVHWSRHGKKRYLHIFPLVWYGADRARKSSWLVAGPYYASKTATSSHHGLFPLVFWGHKGHRSYRIGFPLYWDFSGRNKRVAVAGPFFYHSGPLGERGGGLFPLLWVRHNRVGMKQVSVFPLFHVRTGPLRTDVWSPVTGYGVNRANGKSYGYAGPFLWRREQSGRKGWDTLFPFYWRSFDKRKRHWQALVPPALYWGDHGPDRKIDIMFPFLWMKRTVTGHKVVFFPFWWDFHDYYLQRSMALFPFFYYRKHYPSNTRTWIVPPGIWLQKSPGRVSAVAFPLVWHFASRSRSSTVVFPLVWDFKRRHARSTVVFPFVWRFRRHRRTNTVVFPFWWDFDGPNRRTVVAFNSYYWKNKTNGTYRFYFLPLFDFGRARPGDFQFNVLGGMFGYARVGRRRFLRLLFFNIPLPSVKRKKRAQRGGPRVPVAHQAPSRTSNPSMMQGYAWDGWLGL